MKIFSLRPISNLDKFNALLKISDNARVKKPYTKPRTYVYNKSEDLVSQAIRKTEHFEKISEYQYRYKVDYTHIANIKDLKRIIQNV